MKSGRNERVMVSFPANVDDDGDVAPEDCDDDLWDDDIDPDDPGLSNPELDEDSDEDSDEDLGC
jgi:hypothetical protein